MASLSGNANTIQDKNAAPVQNKKSAEKFQ